jgi:hypothetical protein
MLICEDPAYKKMTFDDVFERIINHEMNIQEANNIKISTMTSQHLRRYCSQSKEESEEENFD